MKKCYCYDTVKRFRYVTFDGEHHYVTDGVCNGTKERDVCGCNGDRINCSFYPYVREEAKKEITIQNAINYYKYGISHDIFKEPVTTYAKMAVEGLKKLEKIDELHFCSISGCEGMKEKCWETCPDGLKNKTIADTVHEMQKRLKELYTDEKITDDMSVSIGVIKQNIDDIVEEMLSDFMEDKIYEDGNM